MVKTYKSKISIDELESKMWDSLFCMSRSYTDAKLQGCSFRMLLLALAVMTSCIAETYGEERLKKRFENTINFLKINNCTCDVNFEQLCPSTSELFSFMCKYYNFCNSRENKKLESYEFLDVKYTVPKLTKTWWGPRIWFLNHALASFYDRTGDPNYIVAFKCFQMCLVYVLPCEICRAHYLASISKKENDMNNFTDSNENLLFWTFIIHNEANYIVYPDKPPHSWDTAMKAHLIEI